MAKFLSVTLNKLLFLLILANGAISSKLNVPHVLLPIFTDVKVHFTLEAVNGGCYKWSTTRGDVIKLTPLEPDPQLDCSTKAEVYSIAKDFVRNTAVVLAEDTQTQLVLRVDVIVDVIESLSIATTTKEIIMHETPEAFRVIAQDNQGNQFTSLDGIEFDWNIVCLGSNKDLNFLRFMTFQESTYEAPDSIADFEEKGKKGHLVLLEGIKTGTAKVQVRMPYAEYEKIPLTEVQLSVVANLIIVPADVHVMPFDVAEFKVYSMNNGKMEEIVLPNSQYFLEVEDNFIATADPQTGLVTALKDGKSKVVLRDRNVHEDDPNLKQPSASINVCAPAYITLSLLPHNNWAIFQDKHHDLLVEVFSSSDHKLLLGPGVSLSTQVGDAFYVHERSQNGSWLTGWAKEVGTAPVRVTLEGVSHKRMGKASIGPISSSAEILIYPRIVLNPSDVILPWDPIAKPKYQVQILAEGGDGKFLWSSSNHSIGIVAQTGNVRTHSWGEFEVSAAMQRNHHNRESAKFYIIPPSRLEIVEYIMEAEVGSQIYVHVALFAERTSEDGQITQMPFTQCQDLPLKVKTSDSNFKQNREEIIQPVGISCANVAVVGTAVGNSKVTVSYNKEGRYLEDSVTVTTYKPVKLLNPTKPIVLAVGTEIQLVYTGGPQPTPGKQASFRRDVTVANPDVLEGNDVTSCTKVPNDGNDYTVVKVLCRKLGETKVSLSLYNSPIVPNSRSHDAAISTQVICGKPRSLTVQPEIKVSDVEACPMDLSSERVIVQSNQNVELDVIVRDDAGLRFLNVSSLLFAWTMDDEKLGTLAKKDAVISRDDMRADLNYGDKSYQVVTPKIENGLITVKGRVTGYRKEVLSRFKITSEWPEFLDESEKGIDLPPIEAQIVLYLVDDTIVTPDALTLYNHPTNKRTVNVKQGSGYYELLLSDPDIAEVSYSSGTREIEITPKINGDLKISLVDLCLVAKPAAIMVNVVSVSIVRVEMSDKVEMGKCIPAVVKLYDDSDNLLNVPDVDMIQIKVDQGDAVASFRRLEQDKAKPWPIGHVNYIVQGENLGNSKVTFQITSSMDIIESAPLDLQVFAPLRIQPRNVTLLIGSSIQYTQDGGPEPDSHIEYTVPDKVGEIGQYGILTGKQLGRTKVTAKALGINPTTGQKVIYATDTVDVSVIPVQGFKIKAPLTRFRLDADVPAWATGLPEQLSPLILGTVTPDFTYRWSVEDPDMVRLEGAFKPVGIEYDPVDQISVRLRGLKTGSTHLTLNVTVPGAVAKSKKPFATFTDTIEIEVFDALKLKAPAGFTGKPLLLAPHSSIQLETNMDTSSDITYRLIGENSSGDSSTKSLTLPNPTVTVSDAGLLRSHSQLGYSMVLIVATDNHGLEQTLSVIVEVKSIYYMRLNVVANWSVKKNENTVIPLGTEFLLKATYHDNTGNEFTAGSAELHVRTSRMDLVRIKSGGDNSTLSISTRKPGVTVMKVWADGVQKTADYIKLRVGQTVTPSVDQVVTGDIICMWTPVTAHTPTMWASSDGDMVIVDPESGVGMAVATKSGQVLIMHTLHPSAPLQLHVLPITNIVFIEPNSLTISNAANDKTFEVPLLLLGESSEKKNNLLNAMQCQGDVVASIKQYPYSCEMEFSNETHEIDINAIFRIESSFNPKMGTYGCKLTPTGVTDPNVSTLDTKIKVTARSQSNSVSSTPLELDFMPGIFVEKELFLDDVDFSTELIVVGTKQIIDKVRVTPADAHLLEVTKEDRDSPTMLKFKIRLIDYHWKLNEFDGPLVVNVDSPLTEENIQVHIRLLSPDKFVGLECNMRGNTLLGSILYTYRYILAIIVSMIVIFLGTFYAYSQYIQPVINVNVTPVRSLLHSMPPGSAGAPRSANLAGGSMCTICNAPMLCSTTSPHRCSPSQYNSNQMATGGSACTICSSPMLCMRPHQCNAQTYNQSQQRSPNKINMSLNTTGTPTRDQVYGDPTSFYSTSPELRRNRRFL